MLPTSDVASSHSQTSSPQETSINCFWRKLIKNNQKNANWFKVTSSFNSCRSPTTCENVTWTHHSKKGRQQNYGVDMFEMILYYGEEIRPISWCVINSTMVNRISEPSTWWWVVLATACGYNWCCFPCFSPQGLEHINFFLQNILQEPPKPSKSSLPL